MYVQQSEETVGGVSKKRWSQDLLMFRSRLEARGEVTSSRGDARGAAKTHVRDRIRAKNRPSAPGLPPFTPPGVEPEVISD